MHLLLRLHRVRMLQLRGAVLLLLVSAVLSSRELSEAGSGSVVSEAGSGSVVSEAGSPPPPSPEPSSGNTGADGIVASTPVYQTALDQLYAQVDLNPTDGALSRAEYDAMVVKLGIGSESPFNDASFFSTLDADGSGGLSQTEIVNYFAAHTGEVQKAIDALAGVPSGGAALSFGAPSDAIKDARSTIEYSVIVSAELSGIFPGDRQRMRADVAALVGVPTEQVIATFLNATSSRAARRLLEDTLASPVWQRVGSLASFASASASAVGREPSAAAHARRRLSASVRVSFVIFVKDEAAAAAVAATLSSELGGADAASSFLALTVTSLPTVTTTSTASSLASRDIILAGGGLAACVVLLCCCCVALTVTARRRRRKTAEAYAGKGKCGKCTGGCGRGCRRNGCLSFHALKASTPYAYGPWYMDVVHGTWTWYMDMDMDMDMDMEVHGNMVCNMMCR